MRTVDRRYASKAFAIFRTGLNGAQVAGAAGGGLLVAAAGPGWVLVIDAATFLAAAGLRALMRVEGTVRRRTGLAAELKEGWSEFAGRRRLWSAVVQFAVVNAVGVGASACSAGWSWCGCGRGACWSRPCRRSSCSPCRRRRWPFSRVAAYEAVGSFGLTPVGAAPAGPAADRFGVGPALWAASGAILAATVFVLSVPDVRRIKRAAGD